MSGRQQKQEQDSGNGWGLLAAGVAGAAVLGGLAYAALSSGTPQTEQQHGQTRRGQRRQRRVRLYHYTDSKGKDGIQDSEYILKSDEGMKDAAFGSGVYLTSLSPYEHTVEDIARNNYLNAKSKSHVQYAIQLDLDEDDVECVSYGGRDIWIYRGRDLWIDDDHNARWISVQ